MYNTVLCIIHLCLFHFCPFLRQREKIKWRPPRLRLPRCPHPSLPFDISPPARCWSGAHPVLSQRKNHDSYIACEKQSNNSHTGQAGPLITFLPSAGGRRPYLPPGKKITHANTIPIPPTPTSSTRARFKSNQQPPHPLTYFATPEIVCMQGEENPTTPEFARMQAEGTLSAALSSASREKGARSEARRSN